MRFTTDGSSAAGRDGTCASENQRRPSVIKPIDALILEKKLILSAQTYPAVINLRTGIR